MPVARTPKTPGLGPTTAGHGGRRVTSRAGFPPVLVVDDDPAAGAATQATLSSGGYAVTAEAAGDAVLRLVRASMVQLVISELHVPCTEGRCVIAALKGDRLRLPRLRVLVLTRHTSPDDLEWALGVGADAVVRKPASEAVLLREVARLLNGVPTA